MTTKIPVELSSTPGIVDGSNATAITIDSSERVGIGTASPSAGLHTIVDNNLAKYLANTSDDKKIPCFGVLGNLILNFSKILNQKASHEPSGQHILNEEYYDRIEAIQVTMNHDDGNLLRDVEKSDMILVLITITQMHSQLQCGIGKTNTFIVGEEDTKTIGQKLV